MNRLPSGNGRGITSTLTAKSISAALLKLLPPLTKDPVRTHKSLRIVGRGKSWEYWIRTGQGRRS